MAVPRPPHPLVQDFEADFRRNERIDRRISVAYSFEPTATPMRKPTPFRFGTLLNVSEQGICIRSREPFGVAQMVALYLKLTDESSGIKALGKVVWAEKEDGGMVRAGIRLIGNLPSDWRRFVHEA